MQPGVLAQQLPVYRNVSESAQDCRERMESRWRSLTDPGPQLDHAYILLLVG